MGAKQHLPSQVSCTQVLVIILKRQELRERHYPLGASAAQGAFERQLGEQRAVELNAREE